MKTPRTKTFRPAVLPLEVRLMLDASSTPTPVVPDLPANAAGITPAELADYYGTGLLDIKPETGTASVELGKGQTVVLIENEYDPNYADSGDPGWATSTLAAYSRAMGLPSNAAGTNADFTFSMVDSDGNSDLAAESGTGPGQLLATSAKSGEFNLDIQAVHLMAPYADIDVVVIPNLTSDSIKAGIAEALQLDSGKPAVISMSFSGPERGVTTGKSYVDGNGVTYVMSSGDDGAGFQYVATVKKTRSRAADEVAGTGGDVVAADVLEAQSSKSGRHKSSQHHGKSAQGHHGRSTATGGQAGTTGGKSATHPKTRLVSEYKPMAAVSQNEVMVGGTTMSTSKGAVTGEVAWGHGMDSYRTSNVKGTHGGGGGGYSRYNPRPEYQQDSAAVAANQSQFPSASAGMRLGPDLSMMSMPGIETLRFGLTKQEVAAGATVPDHYYWYDDGGTSLSAPLFAGLMAIVAQGRQQAGLSPLSSLDTLNFLYQAPAADFNDITKGNNGYPALPGSTSPPASGPRRRRWSMTSSVRPTRRRRR